MLSLTEAEVAEFHERGYLMGPVVLTESQADALRTRMEDVIAERGKAKPELLRNLTGDQAAVVYQIVNIWQADDLFEDHIYHPDICSMVAQLMDYPVLRVWHDQVQYKPARIGGPTNWHQDHPYWPIIQPPDLISAWLALDDATVENGCMRMVPRSHRWGAHKEGTIGTDPDGFLPLPDMALVPPGETIEIVPCEVRKGQVMFHHCLTWHGSPPNKGDRGRPAIAVHYMPGYTRYEPQGDHPMHHHVTVAPGEILAGEHFPTVWDHGPVERKRMGSV